MKSWWICTNSDSIHLQQRELSPPTPGPHEMLIRMQGAALNRGEFIAGPGLHNANGEYRPAGYEGTGIITAVGEQVSRFKIGDRVMGRCEGAFAEYGLMQEGDALAVPDTLSVELAAATVVTYLTAYDALLYQGKLQARERVLLLGASSGVGVAALQIAKHQGAVVLGTSGSQEKLDALMELGLDHPIVSRGGDLHELIGHISQQGVDLAINMIGGSVVPEAISVLGLEGRLAIVGYVDKLMSAEIDLGRVHSMRLNIFGVSHKKLTPQRRFQITRKFSEEILPLFADGSLCPVIDAVYDFQDLEQAAAHLSNNRHIGKVVITINS